MSILSPAMVMLTSLAMAGTTNLIRFQSPPQRTAVLELYTSEGCSSCPPAERWLSRLSASPQLWRNFVPVAFHVDYWDYLGWRDPWAAKQFTDRQRNYAAAWHSDSIYTPGFVLNGQEWRGWSRRDTPEASTDRVGILAVTSADTNNWLVHFSPVTDDRKRYEAHAAWLVNNVKSDVKAGENRGRTLRHDFVAITLVHSAMKGVAEGADCQLHSPVPTKLVSGRLAVAIWVTEAGRFEPIQATGGWVTSE